MDLSGQEHFVVGGASDRRATPERLTSDELAYLAGERLLLSASRLLQRADVACVDIELRDGGHVAGVRSIRIDGPIALTASRRGGHDHSIALDRVIGIRTIMASAQGLG
ncbi:MAG TPA: hypothetical protein PK808_06050 [Polymorphobacter sp.]|nr:hypothetical protein [Polymorphobacter sp.]